MIVGGRPRHDEDAIPKGVQVSIRARFAAAGATRSACRFIIYGDGVAGCSRDLSFRVLLAPGPP